MYQPQIKASQITNLTDARYFAAWDVEWLGFNLQQGTDTYLEPVQVMAIKGWIEGPKVMGEFSGIDLEEVQGLVESLELEGVQVTQFADSRQLKKMLGIPVMVEIVIENSTTENSLTELADQHKKADYLVIDFAKNGLTLSPDSTISFSFLQEFCRNHATFIRTGNLSQPTLDFLNQLQPSGLSVQGGEEEKVGVKSFNELDGLFEELEGVRNGWE